MNEFELIHKIGKGVPRQGDQLHLGIDDDAAVIEGPDGNVWLVTTDILAEDVHFKRGWADWRTLGKKALLVNISDIAAMGGVPRFYFVSISCPKDIGESGLIEIFNGMKYIAGKNGMILVGGDTTASKCGLFVSLTVIGRIGCDKVVYRSGAKAGDKIYVSGTLGSSAAGLLCLENNLRDEKYTPFIYRHLVPEPRLALGSWLAQNGCASSMIDISDGLKGDIDHIAEGSGVGYKIYADKVPFDKGAADIARAVSANLMDMVISGGEDYELLFTMNTEQERRFLGQSPSVDFGCAVTCIGEIVRDTNQRKLLDNNDKEMFLSKSGFVHDV